MAETTIEWCGHVSNEIPLFDLETALGHLGAFLCGGDEMGTVSDDAAADALKSICIHIARMRAAVNAAHDYFMSREDLTADDAALAVAGLCAENANGGSMPILSDGSIKKP